MSWVLKDILHVVILSFGSSALALAGRLAHKAVEYLGVKTHNERAAGVLDRLSVVAQSIVKDVFNSYVQPIQAAGKWDDASANVARAKALATLKSYLGDKGIAEIAAALGANASVTNFLETIVEQAIHDAPGVEIPPPSTSVVPAAR